MSNNRMWLINDRTRAKVLLAKYYPSSGWEVFGDPAGHLTTAFNESQNGYAWGDNDWRIVYDHKPNGEPAEG